MLATGHAETFSYGSRDQNEPSHAASSFFCGHHRHESRGRHEDHHTRNLRVSAPVIYAPEDSGKRSASHTSTDGYDHGHDNYHDYEAHSSNNEECEADDDLNHEEVKVGKKRQVVGILVSLSCSILCQITFEAL
jgi:zinc transporter 1/2/3